MLKLPKLSHRLAFPPAEQALDEPNGLLAFGGDLSVERLQNAYRNGIFPWFSDGEPILWWSPDPRCILPITDFYCSKSLAKLVRQQRYQVSINTAFVQVIQACAHIPRHDSGTWITNEMINAYVQLHRAGHAHSLEVWDDQQLVGGLYGVAVGKVFCGESMFHQQSNCSKLAFYYLVQHLTEHGYQFIDCQMQTDHLSSLGAKQVTRRDFIQSLRLALQTEPDTQIWQQGWISR